ncbi:MAG: ABC transporter permease [Acidobacteriia bacterium]|nr:ABC transporter permease [Terriglobia bacterium]
MGLGDLLRFAGGALLGHRLRTGLSLLGVAIGVAAVTVLTSLGEGARLYVTGEFASLGSNLLILVPGKTETTGVAPILGGTVHELTLEDVEALPRRIPLVRRVAPLSVGTATARAGERSREITVVGTTREMLGVRHLRIGVGRYLPDVEASRAPRVCVLGAKVQRELYPERNPLGELLRIGDERYRVIGVMVPRGTSLGIDLDEAVHVPVVPVMKLFNRRGLFRALLEISSHDRIEEAKGEVLRVLKERHDGIEDVTVFTQDAVLATFGRILWVLTAALAGIAAISLSVAGIGIMNVMLVSVSERTREVGLLKALGATEGQILRAFLAEAALISGSGGAVGLAAGFAGNRLLMALYPAFLLTPPEWAVAGAVAVSLLVGTVFGALPARRASRLDPVAALAGR